MPDLWPQLIFRLFPIHPGEQETVRVIDFSRRWTAKALLFIKMKTNTEAFLSERHAEDINHTLHWSFPWHALRWTLRRLPFVGIGPHSASPPLLFVWCPAESPLSLGPHRLLWIPFSYQASVAKYGAKTKQNKSGQASACLNWQTGFKKRNDSNTSICSSIRLSQVSADLRKDKWDWFTDSSFGSRVPQKSLFFFNITFWRGGPIPPSYFRKPNMTEIVFWVFLASSCSIFHIMENAVKEN